MGTDQRFSLKWNNYQAHLVTAFESLLGESDFVDVTLGVEGRRLSAHKMLLSACSPYFRELLKGNPCQHPIIVLRDIRYDDLHSLLQFMYNGEVNVAQDQLNSFLKSAESLKIRGLTDNADDQSEQSKDSTTLPPNVPVVKKKRPPPADVPSAPAPKRHHIPSASSQRENEPVKQEVIDVNDDPYDEPALGYEDGGGGGELDLGAGDGYGGGYEEGALAVPDGVDPEHHPDGQGYSLMFPLYTCTICEKSFTHPESIISHKKFHAGLTTCNICSYQFATVGTLNRHRRTVHKIDIPARQ
ncbi:broad-complex core protein isoforms 1/2/3/4/5 isoform X7 [Eurytemora carolleeae]|uniref:broad-complex core protein isoforms 1/2/3/4/5 isoform X7 n=1 Tax=Eurytemora carolleeae TaxID=1294199 RepID=UPI000C772263|nr:broad-complex core protein isoforms 1/2/3/4/5 isoform X7 [Eurytemora carolleeae]|eukprot:XP_023323921.1 broad-complex core protein isoforms 1/2/3/4/5-like isoform X7 [Eurytemora affinis]